jgi:hypothetical protein
VKTMIVRLPVVDFLLWRHGRGVGFTGTIEK